jgi:Skp family chaperone for outer membrane proteins
LEIRYVSQPSSPIRRLTRLAAAAAALCALAAAPALAQQTQPQVPTFQTTPAPAPAQPAQGQAGAATAQQIPIVVGILDTQAILNTSSAGKSLNAQWTAAMKSISDDMAKKEDQLRAQAQQLETARSGNPPMAPADYAAQRRKLEQSDIQYQKDFAAKKQGLDARLDKARETIATSARKAMQDVAKQRGLTLILDRAAVPYSPQPWNITEEVLARLNKALPKVQF